jgi:hypothetical protein
VYKYAVSWLSSRNSKKKYPSKVRYPAFSQISFFHIFIAEMPREAAEFTDYSDEDAGIILKPGKNDVLFGRGGAINSHEGNITFRNVVNDQKDDYFKASKTEKPKIAIKVVSIIKSLSPPGRFLAPVRDSDKNCTKSCSIWWYDVGFKKARAKASQCLRERERLEYKVKKQKETAQAEIQGFEPNTSAHSASPQKCSNHFSVDLPDPSLSQQNSKIILPPNSRKTREVEYDGIQEEAKSAKKLKTIEKKSVDPNTFARPTSLYYSNHHSPIDIPDSFTHRNVRIDLSPITHGRDNFAVISNDDCKYPDP